MRDRIFFSCGRPCLCEAASPYSQRDGAHTALQSGGHSSFTCRSKSCRWRPDPDGVHSFGHGRRKHLHSGQWLWATSSKVDLYSAQYSHVYGLLWAALELVASDLVSTDALLAVEALDHGKQTAFQLAFG